MSKKPLFLGKLSKNSCDPREQAETNSKRTKTKTENVDDNELQHRKYRLKLKTSKGYVCEDCKYDLRKHKQKASSICSIDKAKLNKEGIDIDDLLCKIKDFKNNVKYFEKHYETKTKLQNPLVHHYREFVNDVDKNKPIGDTSDYQRQLKNVDFLRYTNGGITDYLLSGEHKNPVANKKFKDIKNISTTECPRKNAFKQTTASILKCPRNTSNESINNKKKLVQINPCSNAKQFQTAAEDFIAQAEDLKVKIGYILECCGYNSPMTAVTESSKSIFSMVSRECTHSKNTVNNTIPEHDVNLLFENVNRQYREILKALLSIQTQIAKINGEKKIKKTKRCRLFSCVRKGNSDEGSVSSTIIRNKPHYHADVRLRAGRNDVIARKPRHQIYGSCSESLSDSSIVELEKTLHKNIDKLSYDVPLNSKNKKKTKFVSCLCF